MKITNADINAALAAMVHICCTGNRLDSLVAVRAYRIKEGLAKAWESVDAVRLQLCKDHGEIEGEGSVYLFRTAAALAAFDAAWNQLQAEERELELETITPAEIEAGWFRTAEGKKEKFDLSPQHRGILTKVGIIAEPTEEA